MKAILVIDMPESCEECCCAYYTEGISHDYCQAVGYETYIKGYMNKPSPFDKEYKGKRPKWCPMKPVPKQKDLRDYAEKIDSDFNLQIRMSDYINGYNKCIDELLGEE